MTEEGYIERKQQLLGKGIFEILEQLPNGSDATYLGLAVASFAPSIIPKLLQDSPQNWTNRLDEILISRMEYQATQIHPETSFSLEHVREQLQALLSEPDSLTKAISLYLLSHLDLPFAQQQAQQMLDAYLTLNPLVKETAKQLIIANPSIELSTLEKILYLSECQ